MVTTKRRADAGRTPDPSAARRDALLRLYDAEHDGMVRLAALLTGSAPTAEDVVQEAFIRVFERLDATLTVLETDYRNSLERRLRARRPGGASPL